MPSLYFGTAGEAREIAWDALSTGLAPEGTGQGNRDIKSGDAMQILWGLSAAVLCDLGGLTLEQFSDALSS
jgi:hypothetical protein